MSPMLVSSTTDSIMNDGRISRVLRVAVCEPEGDEEQDEERDTVESEQGRRRRVGNRAPDATVNSHSVRTQQPSDFEGFDFN